MWCLAGNPEVEVHEGDFRAIPDVVKRLNEADVVVRRLISSTSKWVMMMVD